MADLSLDAIRRRAGAWRRSQDKQHAQMVRDGRGPVEAATGQPARDREWLLGHIALLDHRIAALTAEVDDLRAQLAHCVMPIPCDFCGREGCDGDDHR